MLTSCCCNTLPLPFSRVEEEQCCKQHFLMAAGLEEHLQTVLENALTGLEMDQSGNTFAAQLAYRSALSCLAHCTDNLLSERDPLVWLEAIRQVQSVLADRIQAQAKLLSITNLHYVSASRYHAAPHILSSAAAIASPSSLACTPA